MLRGINQQQIFEDDEDNSKFISILKEYKDVFAFKVLAYCLMGKQFLKTKRTQNRPLSACGIDGHRTVPCPSRA